MCDELTHTCSTRSIPTDKNAMTVTMCEFPIVLMGLIKQNLVDGGLMNYLAGPDCYGRACIVADSPFAVVAKRVAGPAFMLAVFLVAESCCQQNKYQGGQDHRDNDFLLVFHG